MTEDEMVGWHHRLNGFSPIHSQLDHLLDPSSFIGRASQQVGIRTFLWGCSPPQTRSVYTAGLQSLQYNLCFCFIGGMMRMGLVRIQGRLLPKT